MGRLILDISMSLDGFVAGPEPSLKDPLGEGGERLHDWVVATRSWRESHDKDGGETGVDDDAMREAIGRAGATIMGRRMYSGGSGPWSGDPNADGWWGEEPPFHHAVFVLTSHPREPLEMRGGTTFTFVSDGIDSALEQARAAAGDRDVAIGGGARTVQQYLVAGQLDEMQIHVAPLLLGGGVRLFEKHARAAAQELEPVSVVASPTGVAHLRYRVAR